MPITIGPDSGAAPSPPKTWTVNFNPPQAPGGTKLLVLHFENIKLPAKNRLEVELGYGTDKFTSADGSDFWTRPINIYAFSGGVPIHYITDGSNKGSVQLDRYGRGERHAGEPGHPSYSNCDPFLQDASYTEPTYDPFWYCTDPPHWENVACVPSTADVRAKVARSIGMILTVETSDYTGALELSTCSVTLVDADKVVTAGHCHTPAEALTSSVTFDYEVECDGSRPPGYNARWYKVAQVLARRWDGSSQTGHDFSLLQLAEAPAGIPAIQMRPDVPGPGEQIFGVHHPNAAVKKLSIPHSAFDTVQGSGPEWIYVPSDFHVSGGSSGSGLFDAAGRIIGVLSFGDPCHGGPPSISDPVALNSARPPSVAEVGTVSCVVNEPEGCIYCVQRPDQLLLGLAGTLGRAWRPPESWRLAHRPRSTMRIFPPERSPRFGGVVFHPPSGQGPQDPVWPDNVHETGVSLDGQSGSPTVAAEAPQVEQLEEDLVMGPIRGFCALQGPDPKFNPPRHEGATMVLHLPGGGGSAGRHDRVRPSFETRRDATRIPRPGTNRCHLLQTVQCE